MVTKMIAVASGEKVVDPPSGEKVVEDEPVTCSICMDTPEDKGVLDCVRYLLCQQYY